MTISPFVSFRKRNKAPLKGRMETLLLCGAAVFFALAAYETHLDHRDYTQNIILRNEIRQPSETSVSLSPPEEGGILSNPEIVARVSEPPKVLSQYEGLIQKNNDFFGWIRIEGTDIDYPVMHTPEYPEKYLHQNFDEQYSFAGTIFADYRCSATSDNLILYGHQMKDGTMFSSLKKYKDKAFYNNHPRIMLDTRYERRTYEVFAVFYDKVYLKSDTDFKYYEFIDAENEAEYLAAVDKFQKKSLYDTQQSPCNGERLLTLSTCSYHEKNGRFVVVAREIYE